jgi:hypothetical protein
MFQPVIGPSRGESNRVYVAKEGDIKMKATSLLHAKGKLIFN